MSGSFSGLEIFYGVHTRSRRSSDRPDPIATQAGGMDAALAERYASREIPVNRIVPTCWRSGTLAGVPRSAYELKSRGYP